MKFGIFAVAAFWFAKLAASGASAAAVDLHALGFKLWNVHKGDGAAPSVCPLGTLPAEVFLHRTVDHNGAHFTWVKPVHGLVNGLTCKHHEVWKGLDGEFLVDFHFFGKTDGVKLVHLEHLTKLGGVAHVFLKFEGVAAGKAVGLAAFVADVAALMGAGFLNVKDLPAHALLHELAFHLA